MIKTLYKLIYIIIVVVVVIIIMIIIENATISTPFHQRNQKKNRWLSRMFQHISKSRRYATDEEA